MDEPPNKFINEQTISASELEGGSAIDPATGLSVSASADSGGGGDPSLGGDAAAGPEKAALDLYLLDECGGTFKATVLYDPYFYVLPKTAEQLGIVTSSRRGRSKSSSDDTDSYSADSVYHELLTTTLLRKYEAHGLARVEVVRREDLDEINHLGHGRDGRPMLKLIFDNVQQLQDVRMQIMDIVRSNKRREEEDDAAVV